MLNMNYLVNNKQYNAQKNISTQNQKSQKETRVY